MKLDDEKITLDFKSDTRLVFETDRELLKQLERSFVVKVWRKFPVKDFKPQVDEKKEPEFDLLVKEELLGFAVVSLHQFVTDNSKTEISLKYPLFEYGPAAFKYYNLYWPNTLEQKYVEAHKDLVEKMKQDKYFKKPEEEVEAAGGKKDPRAAAKKPDPKKKKPAAGPGGKKVVEEEVKVAVPAFEVSPRAAVLYCEDFIAKTGANCYSESDSKLLVAGPSLLSISVVIS